MNKDTFTNLEFGTHTFGQSHDNPSTVECVRCGAWYWLDGKTVYGLDRHGSTGTLIGMNRFAKTCDEEIVRKVLES